MGRQERSKLCLSNYLMTPFTVHTIPLHEFTDQMNNTYTFAMTASGTLLSSCGRVAENRCPSNYSCKFSAKHLGTVSKLFQQISNFSFQGKTSFFNSNEVFQFVN